MKLVATVSEEISNSSMKGEKYEKGITKKHPSEAV